MLGSETNRAPEFSFKMTLGTPTSDEMIHGAGEQKPQKDLAHLIFVQTDKLLVSTNV